MQYSIEDLLQTNIEIPAKFSTIRLEDLELSVRLWNVLGSIAVTTLGDLSKYTYAEIISVRNCGKKTLFELGELIRRFNDGDHLSPEPKPEAQDSQLDLPEYLRDLPIKLLCQAEPFRRFLLSRGIKTLADLQDADKHVCESVRKKFRKELALLTNGAINGEFDQYVDADQRTDVKALIVRSLHGAIRVPEAMKGVAVAHVSTSVRLANVLESFQIKTFGELQTLTFDQLKAAENCGAKSIFELWQCLIDFSRSANKAHDTESDARIKTSSELSLVDLLEVINTYVLGIADRDRTILRDRFGGVLGKQTRTLEEIGQDFGVTRERIRQIESKHVRRLRGLVASRANRLIADLIAECEAHICPLTADLLVAKSQDHYSAFHFPPAFYLHLLSELFPELAILGETLDIPQSRLDRVQSLVRQIESALKDSSQYKTLHEVWEQILDRRLIERLGMSAFFDATQSDHFEIVSGDVPSTLLIRLKRLRLSSSELTLAVLSESDVPLTPEQIIERAIQKYGPGLNLPSPNSLANLPGYDAHFYLLDRRRLGLREHFQLATDLWDHARDDCYEAMKRLGRPCSTNEIVADFGFAWTSDSTANELAAILREDERFVDLGRLLYSLSEWPKSKREPVNELISEILGESTRPLRAAEIIERVRLHRSFSATSLPAMLRAHNDVEDLGFGYYGLKSKGPYTEFLSTDPVFLRKVVRRRGPLTVRELGQAIGLPATSNSQVALLSTLRIIPEIRLSPAPDVPDTLVTYHRVFRSKTRS